MPEEPHPADRHVLLVDDEPDFLDELALYLRRRGWTVTTSASPCEAMAQLDLHAGIAVVVTDIRIGSLDGFDLARRIVRERRGRQAIAVMVMTGHGKMEARSHGGAPPDLPILRKPLLLPDFLATLDAGLACARQARAACAQPERTSRPDGMVPSNGRAPENGVSGAAYGRPG